MSRPSPDEQKALNQLHLDHPKVGDYWDEMCVPICVVLRVNTEGVLVAKVKIDSDGDRYLDSDQFYLYSLAEFRAWLSYGSIPGTWADVNPEHSINLANEYRKLVTEDNVVPGAKPKTVCKGMNCHAVDGYNHSIECKAEHAASVAGGQFISGAQRQQLLKFLDQAAAEGFILDGVDAATLYVDLFPHEYNHHDASA